VPQPGRRAGCCLVLAVPRCRSLPSGWRRTLWLVLGLVGLMENGVWGKDSGPHQLDGWPIEPKISSIAENSVLWWFFRIFLIRIHVLYYIYKKIAKNFGYSTDTHEYIWANLASVSKQSAIEESKSIQEPMEIEANLKLVGNPCKNKPTNAIVDQDTIRLSKAELLIKRPLVRT